MTKKFEHIRNFSIIAHIDHGKSTLADRLIQACGTVSEREMQEQMLDSMDIERERGITIKAQSTRLYYQAKNGKEYQLNFIDTPGHVDFSYEVSRSLAACEGALLVVDSTQGVEAQTLANVYMAIENNLEIITVLNKIDLPAAEPEKVKKQIEEIIGLDTTNSIVISAKTGLGIEDVLEAIVNFLPPPSGKTHGDTTDHGGSLGAENAKILKAMLLDSWYDSYLGIIILVRIIDGKMQKGQKIKFVHSSKEATIENIGYFNPKMQHIKTLEAGEVGFITTGIKTLSETKVGDTIVDSKNHNPEVLQGFKQTIPVVFCSLFPVDNGEYEALTEGLQKLHLNDASFTFEQENSPALGFGYRCGFLGLLHLEIIQERLTREFNANVITTAPSVIYKIKEKGLEEKELDNPNKMPDPTKIEYIKEPWIEATIITPDEYLGKIIGLCEEKRGVQKDLQWSHNRRVLIYKLPLNEVVFDFYDKLKSISRGYASFDYEIKDYEISDLVKVTILVNNEEVEPLTFMSHRSLAETKGREICDRLKDLIPRQMFQIPIQAAIGGKIIARENVKAFKKDVTAKCYGGDITRKRKLLEKQKSGKKKMRQFGKVEIPQSAFVEVLKTGKK